MCIWYHVLCNPAHSASASLALSSVWLAGPQWHLKCRGLAHTFSATSLSVSVHWRTGTESIRRGSTLKTALKTQCALGTLGVIFFFEFTYIPPNFTMYTPKIRTFASVRRARKPAVLPSLCPAWHTPACHRAHSPPLPATLCHPCSHPPPFLFVDRRRLVLRSSRATSPTRLTQQHQLRSRRAFFAFVCAGIASTGATVHQ